MAPRPKTYGTRRSHVKPAGELMDGTTADDPKPELERLDIMSASTRSGKQKNLEIVQKEENQDLASQGLGKENESASGTPVGQRTTPSRTKNVEDESTTVSPAPGSLANRRMSAQNLSLANKSTEGHGSLRKSTRRSINGSAKSGDHNATAQAGFESNQTDHTSPSDAKTIFLSNGFTNDQQSPISSDSDLKDIPSDLHHLAIWVAESISRHSINSPSLPVPEPSHEEFNSQILQDIEMIDVLDNVEGGRMTRGKEKKLLQQLKGKEPINGINPFLS